MQIYCDRLDGILRESPYLVIFCRLIPWQQHTRNWPSFRMLSNDDLCRSYGWVEITKKTQILCYPQPIGREHLCVFYSQLKIHLNQTWMRLVNTIINVSNTLKCYRNNANVQASVSQFCDNLSQSEGFCRNSQGKNRGAGQIYIPSI